VLAPIVAIVIWAWAVGCTPWVFSPLDPTRHVTEAGLQLDLKTWQSEQEIMIAKFEAAAADIEKQKEDMKKIQDLVLSLASGNVADLPGFLTLLFGTGAIGAVTDNIRKRGLISGLKRNE